MRIATACLPLDDATLGEHPGTGELASHPRLIQINVNYFSTLKQCQHRGSLSLLSVRKCGSITMNGKRLWIGSSTVAGIAASALLGLAGLSLSPAPAHAVIYCTYVGYPAGCVARAGVVLRPRPVARAAVRHNAGGNLNGGVNRVGVRR